MPRYCTSVTVTAFLNDINQVTAENKVTLKNVLGTSQKDEAEILRYHKKTAKFCNLFNVKLTQKGINRKKHLFLKLNGCHLMTQSHMLEW